MHVFSDTGWLIGSCSKVNFSNKSIAEVRNLHLSLTDSLQAFVYHFWENNTWNILPFILQKMPNLANIVQKNCIQEGTKNLPIWLPEEDGDFSLKKAT